MSETRAGISRGGTLDNQKTQIELEGWGGCSRESGTHMIRIKTVRTPTIKEGVSFEQEGIAVGGYYVTQ